MKRNVEIPLKGISTLRELLFQEHHFPDAYKFYLFIIEIID